jgi:hypothetical protein
MKPRRQANVLPKNHLEVRSHAEDAARYRPLGRSARQKAEDAETRHLVEKHQDQRRSSGDHDCLHEYFDLRHRGVNQLFRLRKIMSAS